MVSLAQPTALDRLYEEQSTTTTTTKRKFSNEAVGFPEDSQKPLVYTHSLLTVSL